MTSAPLLHPLSDEARFAQSLVRIFDGTAGKAEGRVLEEYLREVAMSLSLVGAAGLHDRDTTCMFEGQRALAIKLLGARADAARIATDNPNEGDRPE